MGGLWNGLGNAVASLGLLTMLWCPVRAAEPPAVDVLVREYAASHDFSGVVRVERDGRALYEGAFGLADRRYAVPVRTDTRFRIASITKLFTAVLVMQQVEQGKLDLDATIATYLPEYTGPAAQRVTLHQLLTHTSGIANSDTISSFEQALADGIPNYQRPATSAQLIERYASGVLVHPPGTRFDYNNADYLLLGLILERVSGIPYGELLSQRLLVPLGLTATAMPDWRRIAPGSATAYLKLADGDYINELPVYFENWYAAGALVSDSRDVARFADALFGGHVLKPASLQRLLTADREEYAYGLWVAPVTVHGRADRVAHRPGRIMGANTVLIHYLDDGLTVVILSNTDATDIDAFGFAIGKALTVE
jgi:D-alanyl-D-alanine carboxypeptidase